jgi:hypothetical protein
LANRPSRFLWAPYFSEEAITAEFLLTASAAYATGVVGMASMLCLPNMPMSPGGALHPGYPEGHFFLPSPKNGVKGLGLPSGRASLGPPCRLRVISRAGAHGAEAEMATFTQFTGRTIAQSTPAREVWLACGRRAGKDYFTRATSS